MRKAVFAVFAASLLFFCPGRLPSADPAPPPPPVTLEQLISQLTKTRNDKAELAKTKAALDKAEAEQMAAIKKFMDDLKARLEELGIVDTPPPPVDVFQVNLQKAYNSTPAAEKAKLPILIAFFAKDGEAQKAVSNPAFTNTADLLNVLRTARRAGVSDSELKAVRDVIDQPISDIAGATSRPLTKNIKDSLTAQFEKTAKALSEIKQ